MKYWPVSVLFILTAAIGAAQTPLTDTPAKRYYFCAALGINQLLDEASTKMTSLGGSVNSSWAVGSKGHFLGFSINVVGQTESKSKLAVGDLTTSFQAISMGAIHRVFIPSQSKELSFVDLETGISSVINNSRIEYQSQLPWPFNFIPVKKTYEFYDHSHTRLLYAVSFGTYIHRDTVGGIYFKAGIHSGSNTSYIIHDSVRFDTTGEVSYTESRSHLTMLVFSVGVSI
jgi:hypothetical protein